MLILEGLIDNYTFFSQSTASDPAKFIDQYFGE